MLALRPNCECCDRDLPADAADAVICSFECTFCADCAHTKLHGRCPNCGEGALLHSYLKVNLACPKCGEDYSHQRADDGPAYLTILIVGHLMAPLMLYVFVEWRPEPAVMATFFTIGTALLSLVLLPRLKGAMVALQWANRMHGFSAELNSDPAVLTHV